MDTRSIYTGTQSAARDTNKVLRNTYMLLSLTLGFSAVVAGIATVMNMPPLHWAIFLIGVYGLMFLTEKNRNNSMGLVFTFALTGLLGYSLGPIINMYMNNGGGEIVMTALGGTALTFFGLSAYALTTKRDLSFIGGMLVRRFLGTAGSHDCQHLPADERPEPGSFRHVHALLLRGHPADYPADRARRRDQLHLRHRHPVCLHLQHFPELAEPAWRQPQLIKNPASAGFLLAPVSVRISCKSRI